MIQMRLVRLAEILQIHTSRGAGRFNVFLLYDDKGPFCTSDEIAAMRRAYQLKESPEFQRIQSVDPTSFVETYPPKDEGEGFAVRALLSIGFSDEPDIFTVTLNDED